MGFCGFSEMGFIWGCGGRICVGEVVLFSKKREEGCVVSLVEGRG